MKILRKRGQTIQTFRFWTCSCHEWTVAVAGSREDRKFVGVSLSTIRVDIITSYLALVNLVGTSSVIGRDILGTTWDDRLMVL